MDDYISRQEVLDKAYAYGNRLEPEGYCVEVEDIQTLPAADVVEVVRCQDCKHWNKNYYQDIETCFEHRNVDGTEQAMRPDDYCSYGEKRDA